MTLYFGQVFLIALLAGMSPGPDFVVVMRNSLGFGLKVGVASALGIALALVVHVAYTVGGFAFILVHHPSALLAIRVLGAAYLAWLGLQASRRCAPREPRSPSPRPRAAEGRPSAPAFAMAFSATS
jgi:threonine/homoserine/homoserine lactone efflux protein